MSKKAPVKKTKRRLKRTVRRSIAALLMITAIGVAAIPVPENYADEPEITPIIEYEDASSDTYKTNENTKNKYAESDDETIANAYANGKNGENYKDKDVLFPTEIVVKEGSNTFLTWQFLYEPLSDKTGKLCKYNDDFRVECVDLGLQPISHYYSITSADYNYYFSNPDKVSSDLEADMDNLVSTSAIYPTVPIVYSYDTYNSVTNGIDGSSIVRKFLEDYYGDDYDKYTKRFKEYFDNGEQGDKPTEVLTASPSMLEDSDKMKFFCEHNRVLSGTDYKLTPVIDYRFEGTGNTIYVAYGGDPKKLSNEMGNVIYEDYAGYIVTKDNHAINVIGDEVFKNVKNVGQINISGQVRYIGDSSFEGARINSIYIGNAETIGNRAFYNCSTLKEVIFDENSGVEEIGYEAFRFSGISKKVSFPYSINKICHGAFSDCADLNEVEFDLYNGNNNLELEDYAFYNNVKLSKVDFGKIGIKNMGKACFAIQSPSGDVLNEFSFPTAKLSGLKEYVLANRRNLKTVNIPYYTGEIPETLFYNCFGLDKVVFSENSAGASFEPKLFYDVTNLGFSVYGPEFYDGANEAYPRISTWDAIRKDKIGIPYVYTKNDKEYYEVAMYSEDGTRYRYAAGNDGELISCELLSNNPGNVDIVIPSKIANFDIRKIGENCFSGEKLRKNIRSITVQDNSISTISAGAFKDLEKLQKVKIGNSVTDIGDNAFTGCLNLRDVYFNKPINGYSSFDMSPSAFVTNGSKLTFHGDIEEEYAPFEWAMNPSNVLKDKTDINKPAVNVCYQSRWNSEYGTHLTVMTDKLGKVTLLDYPKKKDFDNIMNDEELKDFCKDMEQFYYMAYDSGEDIERMRKEFAYIWQAKVNGETSVDLNGDSVGDINASDFDSELEKRYGPWINPAYCGTNTEVGYWTEYLVSDASENAEKGLLDEIFEPIIVQAASFTIEPYFDKYPYNFMDNYYSYLADQANYENLPDYKKVPEVAWNYIEAMKEIYVPSGIDSIDVASYIDGNELNYETYIKGNVDSNRMHTSTTGGAVPGLFSGYYEDYALGDSRENETKGNDTIESVILTSVTSLPDYAFDNCEMLDNVELGNVKSVGALPFRGCRNLTSISVSEKNHKYVAQNGILYENTNLKLKDDGTEEETNEDVINKNAVYKIVQCLMTRGKETDANSRLDSTGVAPDPDSLLPKVNEIAASAFENCEGIAVVDLTESLVKVIPENCFKNCKGLINVLLPTSVNQIEDNSFEEIATSTHPLYVTIPGREVDISDIAFNPKQNVTIYTYEDSAAHSFAKRNGIAVEKLDSYRVYFYDYNGDPIGGVQIAKKDSSGQFRVTEPEDADKLYQTDHRPGYKFTGWKSTDNKTLNDPITADMTIFVAQYEPDGTLINGKCEVTFVDGIDGKTLGDTSSGATKVTLADGSYRFVYYVKPGMSFSALKGEGVEVPGWRDHEKDGYKFVKWMADQKEWTESTVIKSSMSVVALYEKTTTSGGTTTTSGSSTTTSGSTTTSSSKNSSNTSSSTSSSSSNTSSSSNSSNTSGSNSTAGTYTVTVENGSGSGTYAAGSTVIIAANTPADGMTFSKWTTESNGVTLASVSLPATTFVMPANNVTVTANYVAGNGATAAANGTGNGDSKNGNTVVDITKPGISNRDLATANVSGSTDGFVVKISETDEATQAVAAALTNKYGSLDSILYYAMDITLWDSTGTYQLTGDQVAGLSVDITIPIPDALVTFGGNNMAGAVVNGDQLENLNESFTTINGVPCIRFTATHFSPYTIYVDTDNLTEGMLDVTPKTGDPIHPKWFLSIGLACLSIILFMKKDKHAKIKTA